MGVSNSENNKDNVTEINIIYNIENKEFIRLFGYKFVENNENNCQMIIENKEYEIKKEYNVKNFKNNILAIKLKGINKVKDMSLMFL